MGFRLRKDGQPDQRYTEKSSVHSVEIAWVILTWVFSIAFIPFFLITWLYFYQLKRRYDVGNTGVRINDIFRVPEAYRKCYITSGSFALIIAACIYFQLGWIAVAAAIFLFTYATIVMARWLSVVYLGVVVNDKQNKVVFRQDMQSYNFWDYIFLRFFRNLPDPMVVKISDIDKLSRQYGTHLFLSGKFGSRRLLFSTKQKRDETVYNIQNSSRFTGSLMKEGEFYH